MHFYIKTLLMAMSAMALASPAWAALPKPPPPTKDSFILIRSQHDANWEKIDSRLYLANARNDAVHRLTGGDGGNAFDGDPDWSADGRLIAFVRRDAPSSFADGDVYVLNLRSMRETRMTTQPQNLNRLPRWNPTGQLAYAEEAVEGGPCVYVFTNLASRAKKKLFCFDREIIYLPYGIQQLDWSEDGESIIATANGCAGRLCEEVVTKTYRVEVASGNAQLLATRYGYVGDLRVSPTSEEGYYSNWPASDWVDLRTGEVIEARIEGNEVAYSTSGRNIAVNADSAPNVPPGPYFNDVFRMGADGSGRTQLSDFRSDGARVAPMDWSSDDTKLLVNVTYRAPEGSPKPSLPPQVYLLDTHAAEPSPGRELPEGEVGAHSWYKPRL